MHQLSNYYDVRHHESTFSFVDADNLRHGLTRFLKNNGVRENEFDLFNIGDLVCSVGARRYYIYSAVEAGKEPLPWIKDLQSRSNFVFRRSYLKTSGSQPKQEGVDVMLAVEAMQNAFKKNMSRCIIFSDDGDLLPLVDALVSEGIETICIGFNDPEKGDVSGRMRDAADIYYRIDGKAVFNCISTDHKWSMQGPVDIGGLSTYSTSIKIEREDKVFFARKKENGSVLVPLSRRGQNVDVMIFRSELGAEMYLTLCGVSQESGLDLQ